MPATELGAIAVRETLSRRKIEPGQIGAVVIGNVIQAGNKMNPARQATLGAGLPVSVPAMTLNRVCGSGAQAIVTAAQEVALGLHDAAIAGGMENMDRAPYLLDGGRWGSRMGSAEIHDSMLRDGLSDAFSGEHSGWHTEDLVAQAQLNRERAAMRKSQARAIPRPAPAAGPGSAATVGLRNATRAPVSVCCFCFRSAARSSKESRRAFPTPPIPLMSPPAQNAEPDPVISSAPICGSSAHRWIIRRRAGVSRSDKVLRASGRLSVTIATPRADGREARLSRCRSPLSSWPSPADGLRCTPAVLQSASHRPRSRLADVPEPVFALVEQAHQTPADDPLGAVHEDGAAGGGRACSTPAAANPSMSAAE